MVTDTGTGTGKRHGRAMAYGPGVPVPAKRRAGPAGGAYCVGLPARALRVAGSGVVLVAFFSLTD